MTTNNYILCRWRDASTDPPASGWIGLNTMASGACYYGACGYMPGDQWLDVTDRPGVAREDVQAAVDELKQHVTCGSDCYDGPVIDEMTTFEIIAFFTGVTPTEVPYGHR